jgi:hydroxymethylpyrimidine/phosphomethylpyrimidine kinase
MGNNIKGVRPLCLSIAGFDPSGGAGILADIKTFEAHKVLGMAVVTGLTFQNESEFIGVNWVKTDDIIKQIEILSKKYHFQYIKIGIAENFETLEKITICCNKLFSGCKLIWDPVFATSSGFHFHTNTEKENLIRIYRNIFLITPNFDEIKLLTGTDDEEYAAKEISKHCNVFLKGGHRKDKPGKDYLFTTEGKIFSFRPKKISEYAKHGSGCVMSSAVAASLTNGETLQRSCLKAKDYVTKFLFSNKTLLGYHRV